MHQVKVSFPGLDLVNDLITNNNGTPVNSVSVIEWVVNNPSFGILPSEAGEQRLCTIAEHKVDYQISVNEGSPITGEEFDILYPGNFSTHPVHRPK